MIGIPQIINSCELGLVYSLVALAIYISFRIINFADLSIDGCFVLGASVCAVLIENEFSILAACAAAFTIGLLSGYITGILCLHFRIMEILSGILTATALYSINIRIMGRSNLAIEVSHSENEILLLIFMLVLASIAIMILFLRTDLGLAMRSAGQNEKFALINAINVKKLKLIALSFSSGLVALAGASLCLMQGFVDVTMGFGTIIIGLISVIIGERLAIFSKKISTSLIAIIFGSILYRLLVAISLNAEFLKLEPSDLNLISSSLVAFLMIAPLYLKRKNYA